MVVTVLGIHFPDSRVLERCQLGHHLGHRWRVHRRLGHRCLLSVASEDEPTTRAPPPEAPAAEWSRRQLDATRPGKGWFVILRLCGPEESWFDKTWRPSEIEAIT
ncbi:hypothetical protein EEB14_08980 [Rhodococcus sp. WS4]|nr:hypothetical protein EEB14_08980 [Rhodococcus sp. WS4]